MENLSRMGEQPNLQPSNEQPPKRTADQLKKTQPEAPEKTEKEIEMDVNKRREALMAEADQTIEFIKSKLSRMSFAKFSAKRANEFKDKYERANSFREYGKLGGLFDYANELEQQNMSREFENAKTPEQTEALYYKLIKSIKNRQQDLRLGMELTKDAFELAKGNFSVTALITTKMMGDRAMEGETNLRMLIDYIKNELETVLDK